MQYLSLRNFSHNLNKIITHSPLETGVPKIFCIDCVWLECKNLQRINTVEIFYYVTNREEFAIEYNFHKIDFEIWKEIIEIHTDNVCGAILYQKDDTVIYEFTKSNSELYCTFILKSKDFNLYRNINLILYLEDGKGWNNMDEMIVLNSWKI